ncbi:EAL domain-containing protein [uncultured Roseibium sp.]|uniref:putative bifunctional diguanylate cyclase/phosphodiesterase n=1 Tax=uncultured Roseibium sp. TaxID=1936171 RepID=UPI00261F76EA|nr:EAL domain-containing protein [uncultured Roseibium sp.]
MKEGFSIPFNRLVMALFTFGLIGTAIALFWITYLGSLSIAEHEIARSARSTATLSGLVFTQHLEKLEGHIRAVAASPEIRDALEADDRATAKKVIERETEGMTSAVLDILLIDRPDEESWINGSLGLIDLSHQLPPAIRSAMPPDIWVTYTDHESDQEIVTAALSILVLDPESGEAIARIFGGTTVTDSFTLPGELAKTLRAQDLAFYYKDTLIAGIGDLTTEVLPDGLITDNDEVGHHLRDDNLYVYTPLMRSMDGHQLSTVTKQPIDTLQKVKETYTRMFMPFLIYTAVLAIGAALLVNRITSAGLGRLVSYAMSLRQSQQVTPPKPGLISEFNKLARMFQAAFESMRVRDAQFKDMIDGSLHGVLVHADNRILYVNDALLKMLGYDPGSPEQLVGAPSPAIYAPEEHGRLSSYYTANENNDTPRAHEIKGIRKDRQTVWLEQHVRITDWNGAPAYYATITDISERKRQEQLATRNANFDILTGLPNRRLLIDRLRQTLQRNKQLGELTALMILDLDRFKTVNETYGANAGDHVIRTVATRLTEVLGPDQTVARMGGDEFAILLTDPEDRWQIEQTVRDILSEVEKPIVLENDTRVVLSGSLGITLSPNDGLEDEALLQQADTSMYQAKSESGASYRFYASRMNEQTARTGQIEISLRAAIEEGNLHLNFQPIMDFPKGRIVSCEVLARWSDPELGDVHPVEFIKIAEESGLIVPLGEWVLRETCAFFQSCNRNGLQLDSISANISPRQCRETGFVSQLQTILTETGTEPSRLQLEITESIKFEDQRVNPVDILEAISSLGVRISLDDFGTGYSSLSYLKRLPVDTLKIDRTFIKDIERDKDGQALVEAMVAMARSLGISVICEGAETQEQCSLVSSFGCTLIQGFGIARPMSAEDFRDYLGRINGRNEAAVKTG